MTAISWVDRAYDGGRDPVVDITGRIERARARLKRERATDLAAGTRASGHPVFDDGRLVGVVSATDGRPAFGPAAPTVLLQRETGGAT
jgi:CBS domain-containing protein